MLEANMTNVGICLFDRWKLQYLLDVQLHLEYLLLLMILYLSFMERDMMRVLV